MDTDDIVRSDCFEKQLAMFEKNPELDVCGSHILYIVYSISCCFNAKQVERICF